MICGWVEAVTGLGLIVGPIVGSALYEYFGYANTFYIFGSSLVFLALVTLCSMPESKSTARLEEIKSLLLEGYSDAAGSRVDLKNSESSEPEPTAQVGYCALLMQPRFTLAACSSALCYFAYC